MNGPHTPNYAVIVMCLQSEFRGFSSEATSNHEATLRITNLLEELGRASIPEDALEHTINWLGECAIMLSPCAPRLAIECLVKKLNLDKEL